MRKIVLSTVAVASLVALSACGGKQPSEDASAEPEATAEAEPEPAPVAEDVAFADLTGDATKGETVFAQCKTCHLIEAGKNGVGPSLNAVVGRAAGTVEGFTYSDANKNSGITWTPEILFEYLKDPRGYLPGTKMAFPGLKDPQDRADVIAYLQTQGA
jgi:cytochrome c